MKTEESVKIALSMWKHFNSGEWDQARALFADDFEAVWLQSRETIKGADNYIHINREYPGTHKIQVTNAICYIDNYKFTNHVVTEVFIKSKAPDGKEYSLFAVSFFEIQEGKIRRLREYWADTYSAPEWRKHLVKFEPSYE